MTPAQVAATQSNERAYAAYAAQQQKSNSVKATAPPTPNSNARVNDRAYSAAKESDPIQQIKNFLDPVGYMNNPAVMGYAWFKPTTIYVVFHGELTLLALLQPACSAPVGLAQQSSPN